MDDSDVGQIIKETLTEALSIIPEPWHTRFMQHTNPDCDWGDPFTAQDSMEIRCETHDVLLLPKPEALEGKMSTDDVEKMTRKMEKALLTIMLKEMLK